MSGQRYGDTCALLLCTGQSEEMAALQVSIIQLQQQQPWPSYPIVSEHFNLAQNESTTRKLTFNSAPSSIRSCYYYYCYTPHSCSCSCEI